MTSLGTREMAQLLRTLAILTEDQGWFPASALSSSQLLQLQFQGLQHSLLASAGTYMRAIHIYSAAHIDTQKWIVEESASTWNKIIERIIIV